MNLYDTKVVCCSNCDKAIGEVEYDCKVISLICYQCSRVVIPLKSSICA